MPLDATNYETDEIDIVIDMQNQLREKRLWCKGMLAGDDDCHCYYGALNVADHGNHFFMLRGYPNDKVSIATVLSVRWRFRTRAARKVHRRLAKLARRRLSWKFRFIPKFLISPGIIYNDLRTTTYRDAMGLLAEVKLSFEKQRAKQLVG